jgi:predicted enzyme related to lactoylglutathione lyase
MDETTRRSIMSNGVRTIIYPVKDLDTAKKAFTAALGVDPAMDQPYYVGFDVDGQHIGLDPNGRAKGMIGPTAYIHVDDIKLSLQDLLDNGAEAQTDPVDVGGGRLIATATVDGNVVGLLQEAV